MCSREVAAQQSCWQMLLSVHRHSCCSQGVASAGPFIAAGPDEVQGYKFGKEEKCLVQPWLLSSLGVVWPDGSRRGTALRDARYKYAYLPVQTKQSKR